METFAERLRAELEARPSISRSALAAAADVSPQAVSGWLSGKYSVTEEKARKVAAFLGCSWLWLMHGESNTDSETGRFDVLPPAARDWLERQARLVQEFEQQHPLLAGMMFAEKLSPSHIESVSDLLEALERKSERATCSGSIVIARSGKVIGCDAQAHSIITSIAAATDFHLWPLSTQMLRNRIIYKLLPAELSREIQSMTDDAANSGREVGRVLSHGGVIITATAYPFDDEHFVFTLVNISDQIEFE